MQTIETRAGFAGSHPADRDAVAIAIGLCWFGLLSGFVPDILKNFAEGHSYQLATHLHAASAVGWMALLTWQALLVRRGEQSRHRATGRRIGPWLAPVVVLSALATVWATDRARLAAGDFVPARLSFQIGHDISFAVLVGIALWRTDRPDLHKRLMLLAVFTILDTGWSRWVGSWIRTLAGEDLPGQMLSRFTLTWALMIAMGLYDRATRDRLHPAYVPACAFILAIQSASLALNFTPGWTPIALRLLGA